jgi:hypothetical protein
MAAFVVAFVMGKMLKLSDDTVMLIGVGTAICGGSAIAAAASIIRANPLGSDQRACFRRQVYHRYGNGGNRTEYKSEVLAVKRI